MLLCYRDGRSHFGPIVIDDQEIIVISDDEEEEEDELEEEEEDDRQRSRRVAFYQCIEINKALFETLDFYGEEF